MFKQARKGSSYFISKVAKRVRSLGQDVSATIRMDKPEDKPGDVKKRLENPAKVLGSCGC